MADATTYLAHVEEVDAQADVMEGVDLRVYSYWEMTGQIMAIAGFHQSNKSFGSAEVDSRSDISTAPLPLENPAGSTQSAHPTSSVSAESAG